MQISTRSSTRNLADSSSVLNYFRDHRGLDMLRRRGERPARPRRNPTRSNKLDEIVEVRWLMIRHASAASEKRYWIKVKANYSSLIALTCLTIFAIRMKIVTATWTTETDDSKQKTVVMV